MPNRLNQFFVNKLIDILYLKMAKRKLELSRIERFVFWIHNS